MFKVWKVESNGMSGKKTGHLTKELSSYFMFVFVVNCLHQHTGRSLKCSEIFYNVKKLAECVSMD